MPELFGFEKALQLLKAGKNVKREGWKNANFIYMTRPQPEVLNWPTFWCVSHEGKKGQWHPSVVDLMAEDWYEV